MQEKTSFGADSKFYIDPERFRARKKEIQKDKDTNIDCRNETIAEHLNASKRKFEGWIAKKNPRHIPEDDLQKLCEYLRVDPEWLCGKSEYKTKRSQRAIEGYSHYLVACALGDYLQRRGILAQSPDLTINGVSLSIGEFHAYMQELEEVIFLTTKHYIKNLVAFRDSHLDSIEPEGELMAPSLPDPYPSKDPEASQ